MDIKNKLFEITNNTANKSETAKIVIITIISVAVVTLLAAIIYLILQLIVKLIYEKTNSLKISVNKKAQKISNIMTRFENVRKRKNDSIISYKELSELNRNIILETDVIKDIYVKMNELYSIKKLSNLVKNYKKIKANNEKFETLTVKFFDISKELNEKWNTIDEIWSKMYEIITNLRQYSNLNHFKLVNTFDYIIDQINVISQELNNVENRKVSADFDNLDFIINELQNKMHELIIWIDKTANFEWSLYKNLPDVLNNNKNNIHLSNLKNDILRLQKNLKVENCDSTEKKLRQIYKLIFELYTNKNNKKIIVQKIKEFIDFFKEIYDYIDFIKFNLKDKEQIPELFENIKKSYEIISKSDDKNYQDLFNNINFFLNNSSQILILVEQNINHKTLENSTKNNFIEYFNNTQSLYYQLLTVDILDNETIENEINKLKEIHSVYLKSLENKFIEIDEINSIMDAWKSQLIYIINLYSQARWYKDTFEFIYDKINQLKNLTINNETLEKAINLYNEKKYSEAFREILDIYQKKERHNNV